MSITYDLRPVYDSRKSFYGKARLLLTTTGQVMHLISYSTKVASVDLKNKKAHVYGAYSATTLRHIKEFLRQAGYHAASKGQILKDYYSEEVLA